uniref:Uncharacterized protein n=1 Tax=Oryza glumipatula TaxID=40148 RepID=A0A0D9YLM7_9ORYZ
MFFFPWELNMALDLKVSFLKRKKPLGLLGDSGGGEAPAAEVLRRRRVPVPASKIRRAMSSSSLLRSSGAVVRRALSAASSSSGHQHGRPSFRRAISAAATASARRGLAPPPTLPCRNLTAEHVKLHRLVHSSDRGYFERISVVKCCEGTPYIVVCSRADVQAMDTSRYLQ